MKMMVKLTEGELWVLDGKDKDDLLRSLHFAINDFRPSDADSIEYEGPNGKINYLFEGLEDIEFVDELFESLDVVDNQGDKVDNQGDKAEIEYELEVTVRRILHQMFVGKIKGPFHSWCESCGDAVETGQNLCGDCNGV